MAAPICPIDTAVAADEAATEVPTAIEAAATAADAGSAGAAEAWGADIDRHV